VPRVPRGAAAGVLGLALLALADGADEGSAVFLDTMWKQSIPAPRRYTAPPRSGATMPENR
jgi:hypothetical protein